MCISLCRCAICLSCVMPRAPVPPASRGSSAPLTLTRSTQSKQQVDWDSLQLSAFVKATSSVDIEDSFCVHFNSPKRDFDRQSPPLVSKLNSVEEVSFDADMLMPTRLMFLLNEAYYKLYICCCKEYEWCGLIWIFVLLVILPDEGIFTFYYIFFSVIEKPHETIGQPGLFITRLLFCVFCLLLSELLWKRLSLLPVILWAAKQNHLFPLVNIHIICIQLLRFFSAVCRACDILLGEV